MIRILVADDHPIFREGVKKIFEKDQGISVTGEARTGQEVLNKIKKNEYDVILLDISMPGKSWLEVIKEIKQTHPRCSVLVLSMHKEDEYILRAFRAGVAGYIIKDSLTGELITAVKRIRQGKRYVSPVIAEKLTYFVAGDADEPPHRALSDREYEVICLIAKGYTPKEIGEELFIGINTVHTYRARILEKMNLKNTAEIVRYAMRNKLIE
jgi:DNA-binding NarL/FixJ family response regulator